MGVVFRVGAVSAALLSTIAFAESPNSIELGSQIRGSFEEEHDLYYPHGVYVAADKYLMNDQLYLATEFRYLNTYIRSKKNSPDTLKELQIEAAYLVDQQDQTNIYLGVDVIAHFDDKPPLNGPKRSQSVQPKLSITNHYDNGISNSFSVGYRMSNSDLYNGDIVFHSAWNIPIFAKFSLRPEVSATDGLYLFAATSIAYTF